MVGGGGGGAIQTSRMMTLLNECSDIESRGLHLALEAIRF